MKDKTATNREMKEENSLKNTSWLGNQGDNRVRQLDEGRKWDEELKDLEMSLVYQRLPEDYRNYTDKYFLRSRRILEEEGIDPEISVKVFARDSGEVPENLGARMEAIIKKYTDGFQGELHVIEKDRYLKEEPIAVIKGKAQEIIDLETLYLGEMSDKLTENHPDYDRPSPEEFGENVRKVVEKYNEVDVDLLYFGARHYHWSQDKELAGAALENGCVQTSTDIGSSNIGDKGVGTTPHALTLILAGSEKYGKEEATLKTAELFDRYMDEEIPRIALVDTFNREIDAALEICERFDQKYEDWHHAFRIDTCGENIAQGGESYDPEKGRHRTGTGVTVSAVKNLRERLIEEGYGENTEIILSSGFGKIGKAEEFVQAYKEFEEKSKEMFGESYELFSSVGAGNFFDTVQCTADIYQVDGEPVAKKGREQNLDEMDKFIEKNMRRMI